MPATVPIELSSERDINYNCFAWAAEDKQNWWGISPDDFWPHGVIKQSTLEAYITAFQTIEYEICDSELNEPGYEKIAIYVDSSKKPIHAARQLEDGNWTSKVGVWEDIRHEFATNLIIEINQKTIDYGTVKVILKRRKNHI